MRTLEKAIQTAHVDNLPWKQVLYTFLRNYHATPHCSTKKSPAEVLFGRPLRTKLPEFYPKQPSCDDTFRHADAAAKTKMKWHADMKYRAKSSNLKVDDIILCRQQKKGNLCSDFEPQPYKVISVKGPMITALSGTRKITRNSSHFKVLCSSKSHTERKGIGNTMDDSWEFNIPGQTKTVTPATPPSPTAVAQPPTSEIRRYPERENRGPPRR